MLEQFKPWFGRCVGLLNGVRLLLGGKSQAEGALVFAYHDIGVDPSNNTDYYVSSRQFRRQLTLATRWGLEFVDLAEITRRLEHGESLQGLAAVVFDDSLVGVHHHAMPVLMDLGLPATVFAVSDRLGTHPTWWPGAARVMTSAELTEMAGAGFRVASHTRTHASPRTHASLPQVSELNRKDELRGSKAVLEDMIGAPIDILAYPFGHFDRRTIDDAQESGYRSAYSFLNGRVVPGLDFYLLPRLNMWRGQVAFRLAYHIGRPAWAWPQTQLEEVGPRRVRRQMRLGGVPGLKGWPG
jgi:peptidoglycan/xylan/chitin deacetylase (PgdA/CDA1 family)